MRGPALAYSPLLPAPHSTPPPHTPLHAAPAPPPPGGRCGQELLPREMHGPSPLPAPHSCLLPTPPIHHTHPCTLSPPRPRQAGAAGRSCCHARGMALVACSTLHPSTYTPLHAAPTPARRALRAGAAAARDAAVDPGQRTHPAAAHDHVRPPARAPVVTRAHGGSRGAPGAAGHGLPALIRLVAARSAAWTCEKERNQGHH